MSLIPDLKLKPLEEIIGDKKEEKKQEEGRAILPARCENCGKIYYKCGNFILSNLKDTININCFLALH